MADTSESPLTLCDKIWNAHVVGDAADGRTLVHIDRHILHEVSSAQAFVNLRRSGRSVHSPELNFATIDHIVSTAPGRTGATFAGGRELIEFLRRNCAEFGIRLFDLTDRRQGIVHVFAPETGLCLPGCTLVCSDSHTATVGGLGVLAWGVGASEAEHVLTTQTIARARPKTMRIRFDGVPARGTSAKDIILYLIRRLGTDAGTGYVVEYAGDAIRALSVEGRMTVCNMSVEFGARAGLIAPDERVYEFLEGREFAPKGDLWDRALAHWRTLASDDDARFDREETIDCTDLAPQVSWGTSPQDVMDVDGRVPVPDSFADPARRQAAERALAYTGLVPGGPIEGLPVDVVFIGSCTNGRLSDLAEAARIVDGRKVKAGVRAVVVPGSRAVKDAAEAAGLDRIFKSAGFEWRESGCSMCGSINDDRVDAGQRCVSTTNRNFEGRQGDGSRTHLASPATAAASAIAGVIADPRKMMI